MRIKLKTKHIIFHLIQGIYFLFWGCMSLIGKRELDWFDYLTFPIGLLMIFVYFYIQEMGVFRIENGCIIYNEMPPFYRKKIKLTDIKRIRKFAGDYILKTDDPEKEMTIDPKTLQEASAIFLKTTLEKLEVEWY